MNAKDFKVLSHIMADAHPAPEYLDTEDMGAWNRLIYFMLRRLEDTYPNFKVDKFINHLYACIDDNERRHDDESPF